MKTGGYWMPAFADTTRSFGLSHGAFRVLGIERGEAVAGGWGDAPLGNEAADKTRRSNVEAVIGGRAPLRRDPDRRNPAIVEPAGDVGHLIRIALLDGNGAAVIETPVDGRIRKRHQEGNVIVARGERLEISADLIGDIAGRGGPVGADDAKVDQFLLHEMAAGIVGDQRVRHAMRAELERGERGALIARSRLVDPNMQVDALVEGAIDRRERRAPIDAGEPAGIAMSEDVEALAALLVEMRADQPETVLADPAVGLHVLVADCGGTGVSRGDTLVARLIAHRLLHFFERPAEIDGGGACRGELLASAVESLVGGVGAKRERDAIGCGGAD